MLTRKRFSLPRAILYIRMRIVLLHRKNDLFLCPFRRLPFSLLRGESLLFTDGRMSRREHKSDNLSQRNRGYLLPVHFHGRNRPFLVFSYEAWPSVQSMPSLRLKQKTQQHYTTITLPSHHCYSILFHQNS